MNNKSPILEQVIAAITMLLALLAMGWAGGVERGTIPLWPF